MNLSQSWLWGTYALHSYHKGNCDAILLTFLIHLTNKASQLFRYKELCTIFQIIFLVSPINLYFDTVLFYLLSMNSWLFLGVYWQLPYQHLHFSARYFIGVQKNLSQIFQPIFLHLNGSWQNSVFEMFLRTDINNLQQ